MSHAASGREGRRAGRAGRAEGGAYGLGLLSQLFEERGVGPGGMKLRDHEAMGP